MTHKLKGNKTVVQCNELIHLKKLLQPRTVSLFIESSFIHIYNDRKCLLGVHGVLLGRQGVFRYVNNRCHNIM